MRVSGYSADFYLSYCNADRYGDYEHGAFWFNLEPSIGEYVSGADAIFLGSSRIQVALSTNITTQWFSEAKASHYLMGFGYAENVIFARELLTKFRPRAKVYVINIEQFFTRRETEPARAVMTEPDGWKRYLIKRLWQRIHEPLCGTLPWICGNQYVIFRSRSSGHFHVSSFNGFSGAPVSYDDSIDQNLVRDEAAIGEEFLATLPVPRDCILLTAAPYVETKAAQMKGLARELNLDLVMPQLPGLKTFDARISTARARSCGPPRSSRLQGHDCVIACESPTLHCYNSHTPK